VTKRSHEVPAVTDERALGAVRGASVEVLSVERLAFRARDAEEVASSRLSEWREPHGSQKLVVLAVGEGSPASRTRGREKEAATLAEEERRKREEIPTPVCLGRKRHNHDGGTINLF
jgi:hypothetical protein